MTGDYTGFLRAKNAQVQRSGFTPTGLHPALFLFQADIVEWALENGRAAIFADTGLGKTLMQLEWARQVHKHTGGRILILAPLAVAEQTVREAARINLAIEYARQDTGAPVIITNYEMLHHFDASQFTGVVLDESSILKNHTGTTRQAIVDAFHDTPYKLACTATPAPNDHMELGNHSEFLGVMNRNEMLAMYFTHDGGNTSQWRLKGHAAGDFWAWVATWAAAVKRPSDLGYEDGAYNLPELTITPHITSSNYEGGDLFGIARTLQEQRDARRSSIPERVAQAAALIAAEPNEPWVIWCELNDESAAMTAAIPGAVEVTGSDTIDQKAAALNGFSDGSIKVLVSKPSICGFGLNWQHCARTIFLGVGHSFEMFYQSVRRFHRFGQTRPVQVHIVTDESSIGILNNLKRKQQQADQLTSEMVGRINRHSSVAGTPATYSDYHPTQAMKLPEWLRSHA